MNRTRLRQPEWDYVEAARVQRALELGLQPSHARILNALSHGLDEKEAAVVLGITSDAVHEHVKEARRELGAKNTAHLIARALRCGLVA